MYIVTNREVLQGETGLAQFGQIPNAKGPNELRLAEVQKKGKGWSVDFLDDKLPVEVAKALIAEFRLPLDSAQTQYASLRVACDLTRRARKFKRHILFFVHGFNNDMRDVVERAAYFEKRYNVEVIAFSWPAKGGGVKGVMNYKADKRDARASVGALDRVLLKMCQYLTLITTGRRTVLLDKAQKAFPDNQEKRDAYFSALLDKDCPVTVNAVYHSMGNYLLKHMLKSSANEGNELLFDNIVLCQADTNNLDHELWVDKIRFRHRLYITINEDDRALMASRVKAGSDQLARLGHYTRGLNSINARYINLTGAPWVRNSHAPFEDPAEKNSDVYDFFLAAFGGRPAEVKLKFYPEGNWFGVT